MGSSRERIKEFENNTNPCRKGCIRRLCRIDRLIRSGIVNTPSIAAASILAKVTRDRLCIEMDEQFPMYGIAKHKGYGTKDHMAALRKYGAEPSIYRTKFIRFLDKDENENG